MVILWINSKKNPSYRENFYKKSTIIGRIIKVLALSEGEIPFFPEATAFSYPMDVASYMTTTNMPEELRHALPAIYELKK